jgi:hypothetical protein
MPRPPTAATVWLHPPTQPRPLQQGPAHSSTDHALWALPLTRATPHPLQSHPLSKAGTSPAHSCETTIPLAPPTPQGLTLSSSTHSSKPHPRRPHPIKQKTSRSGPSHWHNPAHSSKAPPSGPRPLTSHPLSKASTCYSSAHPGEAPPSSPSRATPTPPAVTCKVFVVEGGLQRRPKEALGHLLIARRQLLCTAGDTRRPRGASVVPMPPPTSGP